MKKLLPIILCLPLCVFAQTPPPAPASAQDVTDGTATYKFISPYSLAQSGVTGGGGGGIAVSNLTGQTYAFATAYTNTTPHYVHLQLNGTVVNGGGAEGSIRTYVDYNVDGVVEAANTYAISHSASITHKVVINEIIPPYGKYTFTNASGGASTASLTATTGKLFFYATNSSSGSGGVTTAMLVSSTNTLVTGLAAGSYAISGVGEVYDVRTYGADPTGTSQSQDAIQAAIDAACVDPSKPVYIPAGTYIMGNTEPKRGFSSEYVLSCLTVWSNNVVIIGDGPTLSVLKPGAAFDYQRNFLGVPDRRTLDIASATSSGTTVTLNTVTPHGLTSGDLVDVNNLTPSGYNSVGYHTAYTVTVTDADTFTYTTVASGMAAATVGASSLVNDVTEAHSLIHTNFTMSGLGFDMENRGTLSGDNLYDTTQIYNVVGAGVVFDDCHFLRNGDNDGIDVQGFNGVWGTGRGNLTVRNCWSAQHGGDALGIQCEVVTITDTLLEDCKQEGLELNDIEDILVNVTVRNCDNVSTLNAYKFTAYGCTFTGTNANDHSIQIGAFFTTRHIGFNNCVFEETRSSTFSTINIKANDSVSIIGCDIRATQSESKPFLYAENADSINVIGNTFGRESWALYFGAVGLVIDSANDVHVADNTFYSAYTSLIITNTPANNISKRVVISANTFNGPVILCDLTNLVMSANLFSGSANALNITNITRSTFIGNGQVVLNVGCVTEGVTNNLFSGNSWLNSPAIGYWTNNVSGDSVTNAVAFGGRKDGATTRPFFNSGLYVYGSTLAAGQAIVLNEPGVGYGGHGFDSSSHRFSISGVNYWTMSSSAFGEFNSGQTIGVSNLKVGNGTVALPAINFSQTGNGDTDSGFYRASAENIGWASAGTLRATTTTTNLFVPNARIDQIVLQTNAAPADAVVVKRWIKVLNDNGQTYLLPGYQ